MSSFLASLKLVPISDQYTIGLPLRATKRSTPVMQESALYGGCYLLMSCPCCEAGKEEAPAFLDTLTNCHVQKAEVVDSGISEWY